VFRRTSSGWVDRSPRGAGGFERAVVVSDGNIWVLSHFADDPDAGSGFYVSHWYKGSWSCTRYLNESTSWSLRARAGGGAWLTLDDREIHFWAGKIEAFPFTDEVSSPYSSWGSTVWTAAWMRDEEA
jgi:hypothetical protein